jgi:peptidoglycan/xylan/chitin deacetylase (PgdA/CDA1 family)
MNLLRPVLLLFCSVVVSSASFAVDREIAITIEDLPAADSTMPASGVTEMTAKLLAALQQQKIPAVGFVNEKKLYKWGEVDERIKALASWLDSGFELGNHTFSHSSLNQVGLKAWEDDVIQGESVTRLLLAQHNMKMRYFRHPFLDTGRDLLTRQQAEAFLTERGYRIAPVTLDAWDWMFAWVYEDARKRGDTALQQEVVRSYLSYTDAVFSYYEQLSRDLLGYEPKHILLLHGNWLEADHINELADLIRKRGYHFTTLADALTDQAYSLPDTFIGEEGTSWLDHWAITRGKPLQGFPVFPADMRQRAEALRKPQ